MRCYVSSLPIGRFRRNILALPVIPPGSLRHARDDQQRQKRRRTRMRNTALTIGTAFAIGSAAMLIGGTANATPLGATASAKLADANASVQTVGWRGGYYHRYGYYHHRFYRPYFYHRWH